MKIRTKKATTWGDIFNRYRSKGLDLSDAAFRADAWEKRQCDRHSVTFCAGQLIEVSE
jgi:hypothetical protein